MTMQIGTGDIDGEKLMSIILLMIAVWNES